MGGGSSQPAPSCPHSGTVIQGEGGNFGSVMWYNAGGHYCKYNYDFNTLQGLSTNPGGTQYGALVSGFCGRENNLAKDIPGGKICAEHAAGIQIATQYCGQGDNIITKTKVCDSGEPLGAQGYQQLLGTYCTKNNSHIKDSIHACSTIKTFNPTLYNTISAAFCEANPDDSFCSCYNVLKDKCDPTSKTGVKGCAETSAYVDLRNATPDDFKSVWDGQRKCGSVCVGANKYIPPGITNGCKTTIQICAQDINVETASGSDIKAKCELNANEGSSSGGGGDGGGGGGENVQIEELIIPKSLDDIKTFIPKGVDGLKTSRRQQTTVGVTSSIMSILMSLVVLIIIVSSGARRGIRR
jgi:hypothetical protein